MNIKHLMHSSIGFGFILCAISIIAFALIHAFNIQGLVPFTLYATGMISSIIFTYYYYRSIMSPKFKIRSMLVSLTLMASYGFIVAYFSILARLQLIDLLARTMANSPLTQIMPYSYAAITIVVINLLVWYYFITQGNKHVANALAHKAVRA